ncbi:acetyltransferase [Vibrio cholerae]|nr:acetyltransferase [Vibrio cholerae]EGR0757285.1 acetyltransferase [Vibrio cholerae]EGR0821027.1 acetyltransferase [Vibrio cholerae]
MQLLCLSLVVMRCQPLRRALCSFWGNKKPAFSAGFRICFIELL